MRSADELAALTRVVDAVRAELADREPDAIPNKLRKAAQATGKTVPAPHQRSMLDHVESDEKFRESLRERWEASGQTDALIDAYLADPATAEPMIQAASASIAAKRAEYERDKAVSEAAVLASKLSEAKDRLAAAKKAEKQKLTEIAESDRRSREGLERSAATARGELEEALAAIEGLTADLAAERSHVEEAQATIKRLGERDARRTERLRSEPSRASESLPSDAVALAAWLDSLERRLRYYRDPARGSKDPVAGDQCKPFNLPLGISPESREAIDAIVDADVDRIVVDGYNVAAAVLFEAFSSSAGRRAALARADMLKRATSASVTVVFDAANVKGKSRFTTDDGTRVMFEPEKSADDAIVFLVQETEDRCVVVTNDRELQRRVDRRDCVVLFTTSLIEWSEHLNER